MTAAERLNQAQASPKRSLLSTGLTGLVRHFSAVQSPVLSRCLRPHLPTRPYPALRLRRERTDPALRGLQGPDEPRASAGGGWQ